MQAAAERLVDFRAADPLDPYWWHHLQLRLQALLDRNEQALDQLWFQWYLAMSQRWNLTQQGLDAFSDALEARVNRIRRRLFPWERAEASKELQVQDMRAQWVQAYGDPDDPEVQAKIKATVELLRRKDASKA